jgi:hypothetical protein
MNFTYFNRNNGDFGELGITGIETLLGRILPHHALTPLLALLPTMIAGEYIYAGPFVVTAVIGPKERI